MVRALRRKTPSWFWRRSLILIVVAPLPALLMDLFLIAISLLVLWSPCMYGNRLTFRPSRGSTFNHLYRLSLNVATTRLILLNGGEGDGQAGKIIQTFGELVVGNNPVVGIVVFIILVTINFIGHYKGEAEWRKWPLDLL